MKLPKHKVTFKIIMGYIFLGVSLSFFGFLVLSEIKTFTELQGQDITDKSKILNVGSLIAEIYENDNLARAAIQLNSPKKFNVYLKENERLLLKIDSLNFITKNKSQAFIFDSIKVILNKKRKNIVDLKKVKSNYNSDESINTVIDKLSSIDSLVNKAYIDNIIRNKELLYMQTRASFRKLKRILDTQDLKDTLGIDQIKIDSLLSVSKKMLKKTQKEAVNQRVSLLKKERELIGNDLLISRKLRELLHTLKTGIINYTNNINKQREKTIERSRKIILSAAVISILIIIIFSVIFLNDFWKNQRYRKQLEGANETASSLLKSREQLISMVSHDLRTPLSTITGYSELLQKSTEDVKGKNYIEHITSASTYMSELVNELMEFSKVESGAVSFKSIPFDLEKSINEIVANSENFVNDKPIKFVVNHDSDIKYPIISDPFKIKQILNNLITNACKFTNKGTITLKSTIKYKDNKNILEISVVDTGIGIPREQQETVFKAFTQVDGVKETNQNGFGLGLTISKKLVELLKGTLTLKSTEGIGSEFTLNIPVKISDKPLAIISAPKPIPTFNISVVVVEDDASIRQLLSDIFNKYQIKSYIFNDAKDALDAIDTITYDLVLTDIQLPKMNGIHFMEVLKNHNKYNNQPVVAMTGRLNLSKADYLNIGFSGVLPKPFNMKEFQDVLHQFFESNLLKNKTTSSEVKKYKEPTEFSITSLKGFLGDEEAVHRTLIVFLEETKKNGLLLKKAKENNQISEFNHISHTMLGMFKQLSVVKIIPFLEVFETTTVIDDLAFTDFNKGLKGFITALEDYLN